MRSLRSVAAAMVAFTVVCVAGQVRAQAPPEASPRLPAMLTLKEALEIFRQRGFDLLVAEANVKFAQGDLIVAGAVPNPTLSGAAGRNFHCGSSQDCKVISYSVGLFDSSGISDLFTGKRGLRKDVAGAALEAARRSRDDAQRTLEFMVKQAYLQAAVTEVQLTNARETRDSYLRT